MRIVFSAALAMSLFGLSACGAPDAPEAGGRMVAPILTSDEAFDSFTFAQPQVARVTHLALDLNLDFEGKSVAGTATLDVQAAEGAEEIVLDSNGLQISAVTDGLGNDLAWEMGDYVAHKGEPLTIQLGELTEPDLQQIVITYAAGAGAEALQWLAPEQTAGGEYPYLFSQGQEIYNRTWIPTQDSPGIRQSWEARITAPQPLNVVMSGIIQGEAQEIVPEDGDESVFEDGTEDGTEDGAEGAEGEAAEVRRAFYFRMDKPVAPYLIAIAAGDITFRELGPRTGVWTEEVMMDAAVAELGDTEAMIDAAVGLYGDYRWGRYDMIVLPPSFPYGGMENPVMTFLTPTFIAGDRSNTGLVAHELAHSWSGNLVTYASWRDGWLNEGVTSYIENRISEVVFGETRAAQERALSFAAVEGAIEEFGADGLETAMRTPDERSPMDYESAINYDKGALFLHTLEAIVGRERFDPWLRSWFDRHAFEPATSEMFIADIRENLIGDDAELDEALMLEEWVYEPGLPINAVRPDPAAFAVVDAAAAAYGKDATLDGAAWAGWSAAEQMRFLHEVPDNIFASELARLDKEFGLSATGNNEIRFLWLQLALKNRYDPAVPQAEDFLASVGRNKFVEPLFKTLMEQGDWGSAIATPLYQRTRSGYHDYTRGNVDLLVDWQQ